MTTIAKFEDFPIEDIEPEVPDRRINFTDADRKTGSGEQPTPDDPTPGAAADACGGGYSGL